MFTYDIICGGCNSAKLGNIQFDEEPTQGLLSGLPRPLCESCGRSFKNAMHDKLKKEEELEAIKLQAAREAEKSRNSRIRRVRGDK